jgi:hypothetical protein
VCLPNERPRVRVGRLCSAQAVHLSHVLLRFQFSRWPLALVPQRYLKSLQSTLARPLDAMTSSLKSVRPRGCSWHPFNDTTFVGVDLCQTFDIAPQDLYYKWESVLFTSSSIGSRYIDGNTPGAIKNIIQRDLNRVRAQSIKIENGLRKPRGAAMVGLGSRIPAKFSHVGLVETLPTLQSSSTMPRGVGKAGTSKIAFECYDIEDVSLDKRNCARHRASR